LSQIILFEHRSFRGRHAHAWDAELILCGFNNVTSSFAIPSWDDSLDDVLNRGEGWELFRDPCFGRPVGSFGRGVYPNVQQLSVPHDEVSSVRPAKSGLQQGFPMEGHLVLFEHANLRGRHRHLVSTEPNLNAPEDNYFNNKISSFVVLGGFCGFFADSNLAGQNYGSHLPGVFRWVEDISIKNDQVSSIRVDAGPAPPAPDLIPNCLLFLDEYFRGGHRHVFDEEANLGAPEDNAFSNRVSSIIVVSGTWEFFQNRNFQRAYATTLRPGLYPSLDAIGIRNDAIASLRVT
jgi:Beta/Gamma crystallin